MEKLTQTQIDTINAKLHMSLADGKNDQGIRENILKIEASKDTTTIFNRYVVAELEEERLLCGLITRIKMQPTAGKPPRFVALEYLVNEVYSDMTISQYVELLSKAEKQEMELYGKRYVVQYIALNEVYSFVESLKTPQANG